MKKFVFTALLALACFSISAQWQSGRGGNDFDGGYDYAAVTGTGQFPYNNPVLLIIKWDGETDYQIQINKGGSSIGDDLKIYWLIKSNEGDTVITTNAYGNKSKDIWYMSTYGKDDDFEQVLFKLLSEGNELVIKLVSPYGDKIIKYTLKGSGAALKQFQE